jgi:folate-binding protein YgfZ
MNALAALHLAHGASLAPDHIPLHYGDQAQEYSAALQAAVLLDRSHEGRISLTERDALALINRLSTNRTDSLAVGAGCATVFTTANARVIERVEVFRRPQDVLLLTHPPRGQLVTEYLRRNIFFNDRAAVANITQQTASFALHGPNADAIADQLVTGAAAMPLYGSLEVHLGQHTVTLARRKPLVSSHWVVICAAEAAADVYADLLNAGRAHGLRPAGSLVYNVLRIRAGLPSLPELNENYIPLELGLWDEVSFHKGCYVGQEIIARMDSRERLAKVLVQLETSAPLTAPAALVSSGQTVGEVTSAVTSPLGEHFAMGVVKVAFSAPGTQLNVGSTEVTVGRMLGTPPAWLRAASEN